MGLILSSYRTYFLVDSRVLYCGSCACVELLIYCIGRGGFICNKSLQQKLQWPILNRTVHMLFLSNLFKRYVFVPNGLIFFWLLLYEDHCWAFFFLWYSAAKRAVIGFTDSSISLFIFGYSDVGGELLHFYSVGL